MTNFAGLNFGLRYLSAFYFGFRKKFILDSADVCWPLYLTFSGLLLKLIVFLVAGFLCEKSVESTFFIAVDRKMFFGFFRTFDNNK